VTIGATDTATLADQSGVYDLLLTNLSDADDVIRLLEGTAVFSQGVTRV
jgi:hypothetical protein